MLKGKTINFYYHFSSPSRISSFKKSSKHSKRETYLFYFSSLKVNDKYMNGSNLYLLNLQVKQVIVFLSYP